MGWRDWFGMTEPALLGRWLRFECGILDRGRGPTVDPGVWDVARADIGLVEPSEAAWLAAHPGDSAWIAFAACG
jgi:hypothetical protein